MRIGSKAFTESVILGELATQAVLARGVEATHARSLGGTAIVWHALLAGDIDAYPEYTGTLRQELLARQKLADDNALAAALLRQGVAMSEPLGFNNTYALGMPEERAAVLGIARVSDLRARPELRFGLSNEFMNRADGWPGLQRHYRLAPTWVRGMQHSVAYQGLAAGSLDITDVYSTDAEVERYRVRVLADDLGYFPAYRAVFLYRVDLGERAPAAVAALASLAGRLDDATMRRLNAQVMIDRRPEAPVAAEFLSSFGVRGTVAPDDFWLRLRRHLAEHLWLFVISLGAAVMLAVPLGIAASRALRLGQVILAATGVLQTVPSLALLVFMIPLLGIGFAPAVAALFFYSLLPIVQNTYVGLRDIPLPLRESALALGLGAGQRLWRIELPLASPSILAGIRTAAVINVGTATLGALIGAGGLGEPILTGIRLNDVGLVLEGAVPAALLALATQAFFTLVERFVVPRGIRLRVRR